MAKRKDYLKVVLVDPPPRKRIERHDIRDYPHLGLAYIAGYLKSKGVSCSFIDAKFEGLNLEEVKKRLCLLKPDIVGVTAMTHEIRCASEVAEVAKAFLPAVTTVIGGPHVTALSAQTIADFPAFDVAVFGEGEYTFFELVKAIGVGRGLEDIKGTAYRTANGIDTNECRELIKNLDELPFPAWEFCPRGSIYPIITARGCPFKCNFCMRVMGNRLRRRTAQNVINELKNCIDTYSPELIHFMDETFTVDKRHLNGLLDLMLENGFQRKVRWDAQTRPDLADYDLFRKMKTAGCESLGFGIESGNEEISRASGKRITLAQAASAVRMAKKTGIKTGGFFILGHPFETPETAKDTINFATKLNTTTVTFGIMTPYPGTEIYEMARNGRGGYKLISTDWDDFNKNIGNSLELETLNRKQLERLQVLGYLKFYLFNLRFISGIQYLFYQRRLALAILKKLFLTTKKVSRKPKKQPPRCWGEMLIPNKPIPKFILQSSVNRYVWAAPFVKGKATLDIGCGSGYGSSYLVGKGAKEVIGGDISGEAIEYAQAHYKKDGLHFLRLDAQRLPFSDNSFDVVVSFEVIEHVARYKDFVSECRRVLKDNGVFICSTPNKEAASPHREKPLARYHAKEFYIEELRQLLGKHFQEVSFYGMDPQSQGNKIAYRLATMLESKIFSIPKAHLFTNFITRFVFRRYHLVKLERMDGNLENILDKRYQPYPIQDKSLLAGDIIAVAK